MAGHPAVRKEDRHLCPLKGDAKWGVLAQGHVGGPVERPRAAKVFIIPSGSPDFVNKAIRDLFVISRTRMGADWLARIAASGAKVHFFPKEGEPATTDLLPNGDSLVSYDPDFTGHYGDEPAEPPSALAHEVLHAARNADGKHDGDKVLVEEDGVTTGRLPGDGWGDDSENQIREEWALPPRWSHDDGKKGADGKPIVPPPAWTGPPSKLQRPGRDP